MFLGLWKWLDKTAIDFVNWGPNEPGDTGIYGAIASLDGSWTTGIAYNSKGFICKAPTGKSRNKKNGFVIAQMCNTYT